MKRRDLLLVAACAALLITLPCIDGATDSAASTTETLGNASDLLDLGVTFSASSMRSATSYLSEESQSVEAASPGHPPPPYPAVGGDTNTEEYGLTYLGEG
jgi:hypothetical protein